MGDGEGSSVYRMSWWSERMLGWAMAHPEFRAQLFRFVDVFPALDGDDDVSRHLSEYLATVELPKALDLGIDAAAHVPFGRTVEARVARRNITRMAEQFILGSTTDEAVAGVARLWAMGTATTVDLLGEKTVVAADADRYAARVTEVLDALTAAAPGWAPQALLEEDGSGPLPRVNISVKPTALATHYEPLSRSHGLADALARLRPICRRAGDRGATVHVDMEHADVKDLTLAVFRELATDPDLDDVDAGRRRPGLPPRQPRRPGRRHRPLVAPEPSGDGPPGEGRLLGHRDDPGPGRGMAGARLRAEGRVRRQLRAVLPAAPRPPRRGARRPSPATTCARWPTPSSTPAAAASPIADLEVQMLHGMAEPMHHAVRRMGLRLRVYAPVGELVPGHGLPGASAAGEHEQRVVRPPPVRRGRRRRAAHPPAAGRRAAGAGRARPTAPTTDASDPAPYDPEPVREWRRSPVRAAFSVAVQRAGAADVLDVPGWIDGERVATSTVLESRRPRRPRPGRGSGRVVRRRRGRCRGGGRGRRGPSGWARTPAAERAAVLFRAAAWMRARRDELAARQVHEAAKPWDQADADVCEAIDFCEYYGREALRLDARRAELQSPPGEANRMTYRGKGVTAVIAPWNFPLAIPCGHDRGGPRRRQPGGAQAGRADTGRGLVAGRGLHRRRPALRRARLPARRRRGRRPRLVEHPDVAVVAFTGSRPVGLAINAAAAVTADGPGPREAGHRRDGRQERR